jgi:hypothetical protein
MTAGFRIERIEPHTVVDEWLGVGLERAHALRSPKSVPEVVPWNLDALGPAPRAELLHVLTLPDFDRAGSP